MTIYSYLQDKKDDAKRDPIKGNYLFIKVSDRT
jgi:hypothetical protein